ncbi:MAG: 50S ribosomal protein L35 [Firmicutes bacterium]|nr:50S ribosomal protein L35 [Bacillota bacterium]
MARKGKTHRGAAKRFKVTGTGKIVRRKACMGHKTGKKSSRVKRRLNKPAVLSGGNEARVKNLLNN